MNKLIEQKVPKIAEINCAGYTNESGSKKAVLTWIGENILYDNKQQLFYLLKIIFKQFSLYKSWLQEPQDSQTLPELEFNYNERSQY